MTFWHVGELELVFILKELPIGPFFNLADQNCRCISTTYDPSVVYISTEN